MNVSYSPYRLIGKGLFKNREGVLIRVEFKDSVGYADCHPWPELGDAPLKEQLHAFPNTPLAKRTLYYAALDADARRQKRSLFDGLQIPPSHWLLNDKEIPEEYTHVKVKVGPHSDIGKICHHIPPHLKIRFDCNCQFTLRTMPDFTIYKDRIDYIEDPIMDWEDAQQISLPIACDRDSDQLPDCGITVVKPAVQNPDLLKNRKRLIVTSYLGHPLGQLAAAYEAARLTREVCGLCSHHVYEKNSFSEQLGTSRQLNIPEGTGFGYDALLKKRTWIPL